MVRRGYDALSYHYRSDDADEDEYAPWLADLKARLPPRGSVLDVGCGCGVRLVPGATFLRADATQLDFPPGSFDAVVCLYALIHMPLGEQPRLLRRIASWLRPSGWLLATTGQDAWTGTEDRWLQGPAAMWWSQADAATYRCWLVETGLEVITQEFVPEGDGGHALFWARRPDPPPRDSQTQSPSTAHQC